MFSLSKSLIRFWETEFPYLKPHKNAKGERRFTQQNIEQLSLIHHLVKERGFTLEGARKEIAKNKKQLQEKAAILKQLKRAKKQLLSIRQKL